MKKYLLLISIVVIAIIGTTMYFKYIDKNKPINYVIYASSQNLNEELRESLINRLKTNDIPYQVEYGNVMIPEKYVEKAVMCCS